MRLKRIEMSGFKSFFDRTTISFDQPMVAIVGPNGCGKSNIIDAIRWVMGEQSPKHLRGRSMEDLIFGGSETRGPLGMSEVSMVLDLTDGVAPARYLDYTEISVTRRMFRDGSSEYLIQKIPCRLKDITDIFMGTGTGSRAYSIIEQGRIGFVLSAKPEERRLVIEEAAGITRYKNRKRAAERRMDATRQNLLRVNDIVMELERQLGSLRRQARKAARYEGYQQEHRELEMWRSTHEYLRLMVESRVVKERYEKVTQERDDVRSRWEADSARWEAERLCLIEAEQAVSQVQEKIYEVENRIKLLESQVGFKEQERLRLQDEHQRAREEMEQLTEQMTLLTTEKERYERQQAELQSELGQQQQVLETRQESLGSLRRELEQCQEGQKVARADVAALEKRLAALESEQQAASRRSEDLSEQISELDIDHEDLQCRKTDMASDLGRMEEEEERRLAGCKERSERKARLHGHQEALGSRLSESEILLETLRTQLHRCRSRLSSLEEIQRKYEGFASGTRAILEKNNEIGTFNGIKGVVADILKSPAEYEPAVEAVLGERLGNVVVEDLMVSLDSVEYLKEGRRGRSSFIPVQVSSSSRGAMAFMSAAGLHDMEAEGVRGPLLDLVEVSSGYDSVARYLLEDVVVVEDLPHAMTLFSKRPGVHTFVTLEGEVVDPAGVVTGGATETEGAGILGQKREIRELRQIAADLEASYQEALMQHMAIKADVAHTTSELLSVTDELHEIEMELLGFRKDRKTLGERMEELDDRMSSMEAERRRYVGLLADLRQSAVAAAQARQQDETRLEELREQMDGFEQEEKRLSALTEETSAVLTEVKVAVAHGSERLEAVRSQLHRVSTQRIHAQNRYDELEQSVEKSVERRKILAEEVKNGRAETIELASEAQVLNDRLLGARDELEHLRSSSAELEQEVKKQREHLDRLNQEQGESNLTMQRLEMSIQHLLEAVLKRHKTDLVSELSGHHLKPIFGPEQSARLERLEELLERMRGDYNPAAQQEFAELSTRYDFLTTQKADLEEALDRLAKAISKINRASRARFRQTFDSVNERFQVVFPRLFNGGQARLVLTESADILESGVEIIAQPPGKKLQAVELLSGGEKALTAVSLIFAIFLHRPSPFCILDEVDAPLDDANVDRYNALIREMSNYNQFILVTHNKRTMEMVDTIYGVTMNEPGVSNIVQVNLKDASRLAA